MAMKVRLFCVYFRKGRGRRKQSCYFTHDYILKIYYE